MKTKPVLSIGIIFKNEIRCIERCLKSLQPLRDAVPSELIMADTGSADGSREIAESYADVLFDFPWINDFAAARNAVMDRAGGKWMMFIDCDEWLEDLGQFPTFFKNADSHGLAAAAVVIRNHHHGGEFSDAYLPRIVRMSSGIRYEGAIHESLTISADLHKIDVLTRTVFHHDGYMFLNEETGAAKRNRNLSILRKELAAEPDSLRRLLQFLESGRMEADYEETLRRALRLVEEKAPRWERFGPPILRYAVGSASEREFPELETWIHLAEERFPKSFFTAIDVAYTAVDHYWDTNAYEECARWGEIYLRAVADFRAGRGDQSVKMTSTVLRDSFRSEMNVRIHVAAALTELHRLSEAQGMLQSVDGAVLWGGDVRNAVLVFQRLHILSGQDNTALLLRFWEQIHTSASEAAGERRESFLKTAAGAFAPACLQKEQREGALRHAYSLYEPLAGKCEVGTAAAILAVDSVLEMERLLGQVEDWPLLPVLALKKALLSGVYFPLPERPLNLEEMDSLALRLTEDKDTLLELVRSAGTDTPQRLCWARGLALAAVQTYDWTGGSAGLTLARRFADIERAFLPLCFAPEALTEENRFLLPSLHHFGWYCARAFDALDGGDSVGYVRWLRTGLENAPAMRPMVEYLTENTPELQTPAPSAELLALAEQVRTMLSAYDPEDPAVQAIKKSPVYQRVAYLIEGGGA